MASFRGYDTGGRAHWEALLSSNGFKRRGGGQRNTYWHVEEGPAGPGLFVKTTPKKLEVVRRQRTYGRAIEDHVISADFYGTLSKREAAQQLVLTRLRGIFNQPSRMDPGAQADTVYDDLIRLYRAHQQVEWDTFGDLAVTLAVYCGAHNVYARAFRDAWDSRDEELAVELLTNRELIARVRRAIALDIPDARGIDRGPADSKEEAHLRDDFVWVLGRRHFWFDHYILRGSGPPAGLRTDSVVQGARRQNTGWWRAIGISNNEYLTREDYATAAEAIAAGEGGGVGEGRIEAMTPVTWDEVVERLQVGTDIHGAAVSIFRGHTEDGDVYYGWSIDELQPGGGHASVDPDPDGPRYTQLIDAVNAANGVVE